MMERESQEQEARRLLAESTRRLELVRENFEFFKGNIELAGIELEAAEGAYMSGDCEDAWKIVERELRDLHGSIKEALELASAFTTQEEEANLRAMLGKISNLQVSAYNWITRVRANQKAVQIPTDGRCPPRYVEGMNSMLSPDAVEFCLKCKYRADCDDDRKQEHSSASTR